MFTLPANSRLGHNATLFVHFLREMFDVESSSSGAESRLPISHILALLAVPSVFISFFSVMKNGNLMSRGPTDRILSGFADRLSFLVFSMAVMAVVALLKAPALFPDEREWNVLHILPVSRARLFACKMAAFAVFIFIFFVVINICSGVFYPVTAVPGDATASALLRWVMMHFVSLGAASIFSCCASLTLFGLAQFAVPARIANVARTGVQLALITVATTSLVLTPLTLQHPAVAISAACMHPGYWYLGIYQTGIGLSIVNVQLRSGIVVFDFNPMARAGWIAVAVSLLSSLVIVSAGWYRAANSLSRSGREYPFGKTLIRATRLAAIRLCPEPVGRAVFQFVIATVSRVEQYQVALAAYIGVATGLLAAKFVGHSTGAGATKVALLSVPLVLSFLLAAGIRGIISIPTNIAAAWVFETSSLEKLSTVLDGTHRALRVCMLLPFAIMTPALLFVFGPASGALLSIYFGVIALLLMEVMLLNFHAFPFATPSSGDTRMFPVLFGGYCVAFAFFLYAFATIAGVVQSHWGFAAVVDSLLVVIHYWVCRYARERTRERVVSFSGSVDQSVQLLNLSYTRSAGQ